MHSIDNKFYILHPSIRYLFKLCPELLTTSQQWDMLDTNKYISRSAMILQNSNLRLTSVFDMEENMP